MDKTNMSDGGFVHLHTHSDHSLLDGVSRVENIVKIVAEDDQQAVALTDHNHPTGIVKLFSSCKKYGIKPIPGIEAYVVDDYDSSNVRFHQVLLAYNNVGYRNLMRIYEESTKHFFNKYNVITFEDMAPFTEGIIATSSCLSGKLLSILMKDERGKEIINDDGNVLDDSALDLNIMRGIEFVREQQEMFGSDDYFIEVQNHGIKKQIATNPLLVRISEETGAPLVATQDSHYERPEDAEVHGVKLAISTGNRVDSPSVFHFDGDLPHHVATAEEMWEKFPEDEFPDACANTQMIADRVEEITVIETDTTNYRIPEFKTPDGSTEQEYLERIVWDGVEQKYGKNPGKEIIDQIKYQLDITHKMGYDGYTLIVAKEIVEFCRENDIRVGAGRGSAAGSAINYTTGITLLDPISNSLIFERYLNPNRLSMPDIDIDVPSQYRPQVVQNLEDIHGKGHVSSIMTLGTFAAKLSTKSVLRAHGISTKTAQTISDLIPGGKLSVLLMDDVPEDKDERKKLGISDKDYEAWQESGPLRDYIAENPTLRSEVFTYTHKNVGSSAKEELGGEDIDLMEMLLIATKIQGIVKSHGVHASGYLVSPEPLADYMPLSWADYETEGFPKTMLEFPDAESIGAMKFDILAIKGLSVLDRTLELIRQTKGKDIDIDGISIEDKEVFDYISEGNTFGMFQIEGEKISELVERLRPESLEDMSSLVALYRPGPLGLKMHTKFADVKNGRAKPDVLHPDMLELFPETYGLCISGDSMVTMSDLSKKRIDQIEIGDEVLSVCGTNYISTYPARASKVTDWACTGYKDSYEIKTETLESIRASEDHKFFTQYGWKAVHELVVGDDMLRSVDQGGVWTEIESITPVGRELMFDITVDDEEHTYVAEGLVVHNCVYQEQLIDLVKHYAGFSAARGDELRRATGKKDVDKMNSLYAELHDGMIENGYTEALVKKFWDMILPFSDYSFNKAHSLCYGFITYQTAWLKYHYPAEFLAASLDFCKKDRRPQFVREIKEAGIKIHPPQVSISSDRIAVNNDGIFLSLSQINGCGDAAVSSILSAREEERFSDIIDFAARTRVSKSVISSLAGVGAFLDLHGCRKSIIEHIDDVTSLSRQKLELEAQNAGDGLFSSMISTDVGIPDLSGDEYTMEEITDLEMSLLEYSISTDAKKVLEDRLSSIISSGYAPKDAEVVTPEFLEAGNSRDVRTVVGYATDVNRRKKNGAHVYSFVFSDGLDVNQQITYWSSDKFDFQGGSTVVLRMSVETVIEDSEEEGEEPETRTTARVKRGSLQIVGDEIASETAQEASQERQAGQGRRNAGRTSERGSQRRSGGRGSNDEPERHETVLNDDNRVKVKAGVRGRLKTSEPSESGFAMTKARPKTKKGSKTGTTNGPVLIGIPLKEHLPSILETLSHLPDGERKVSLRLPGGRVKAFSRSVSISDAQCRLISKKINGSFEKK